MRPRKLKVDKVKLIKRISRQENKIAGRGGPHKNKSKKRQQKKSTQDYLEEYEEELKGEEDNEQ
jgi:hypothetical protein